MITIRTARLADVPTVTKLWDEFMEYQVNLVARENPRARLSWTRTPNSRPSYVQWARRHIRSSNGNVLIAEFDGKVAGYSLVYILTLPPIFRIHRLGHIAELFVKDRYRGLGAGSKLFEEATKWFRRKRVQHLSLVVIKGNDMPHSIYEKWGFFDNFIEMRKKL